MSPRFVLFTCFLAVIISCNNQDTSNSSLSAVDSISRNATLINNEVDAAKVKLIEIQTRTQHELDSLNKLLSSSEFAQASVDEFKSVKRAIGKGLSALEKISRLQPLEEGVNNIYNEVNNTNTEEPVRKQKLDRLRKIAGDFKDSIAATLSRINMD
jgi:hypothetical protein